MKISDFKLRGFRQPAEAVGAVLGKLERRVMEAVWTRGEVSVRDVYVSFSETMAYTTLMTTLDRLHKKGLLNRRKERQAYLYSARVSSDELKQGVAADVLTNLIEDHGQIAPILACIVDTVSERDHKLLDELDRLVKEKKLELELRK